MGWAIWSRWNGVDALEDYINYMDNMHMDKIYSLPWADYMACTKKLQVRFATKS
jgi:hypothetical protein